jgi:medium-chain acyl-[acyl-carrier-protein] hydrolase
VSEGWTRNDVDAMNRLDNQRPRGQDIRDGAPAQTGRLVCAAPNPDANLRLFCFPYAGGGTLPFRSWSKVLPASVEVYLVQLPGRETLLREPLLTRLSELVETVVPELLSHLDKPFALFGHSMGALISFEIASLLRRRYGIEPAHLFVSGCRAPQIERTKPSTYDLPEAKFLEELRRLNGTPVEVLDSPELMRLMRPILRADFELCETYTYVPTAPLDCPITAFGGLRDLEAKRSELKAWCEQTTTAFSLQMFPGDHFFLHTAQPLLLRTISHQLQRLRGRYPLLEVVDE